MNFHPLHWIMMVWSINLHDLLPIFRCLHKNSFIAAGKKPRKSDINLVYVCHLVSVWVKTRWKSSAVKNSHDFIKFRSKHSLFIKFASSTCKIHRMILPRFFALKNKTNGKMPSPFVVPSARCSLLVHNVRCFFDSEKI